MASRLNPQGTADLVARATVARVLSMALSDPDDASRVYLDGAAGHDLERASTLVSSKSRIRRTIDGLRGALAALDGSGASALFARTGTPPYETEYGMAHVFMKVQSLADIAGFYRAFGLEVSGETRERPDHVATEFEFLHFLLLQEAMARTQGRRDAARVVRRARADFVREHLGAWAPGYLEKAVGTNPRSSVARLARVASRFVAGEARRLRVAVSPAPPAPNPQPTPEQERGLCEPPSRE